MEVVFNQYLMNKKCCRHWDSNPRPPELDHLALGVSHSYSYFTSMRLSHAQD